MPSRPDSFEHPLAVHEFATIRLGNTGGDLLSKFQEPRLLQIFALFEQAETFPQYLALSGLVQARSQQVGDELVENGTQIDPSTRSPHCGSGSPQ